MLTHLPYRTHATCRYHPTVDDVMAYRLILRFDKVIIREDIMTLRGITHMDHT